MIEPPAVGYGPRRDRVSRVIMAVSVVALFVGCAHPRADDLNAVLDEYDRAAGDLGWPGFSPIDVPLILHDDASTYLIRHPSPPDPFREMRGADGVWVADSLFAGLSANTDTDFSGSRVAVAAAPGDWEPRTTAALLMHEAFHAYQTGAHPDWTANEVELFTYPIRSARLLQLRRLEGGALRRAVTAPDSVRELCWAQAFLRARSERARRLPDGAVGYDRGSELREGLARYIQARVDGTDPVIPSDGFRPEDVRERSYETGHAIAVLLDRLSPGWKRELVESETPVALEDLLDRSIAAAAVRRCGASPDETARALSVARTDSADLAARDRRALAAFEEAPGWSVEVLAGPDGLQVAQFDPLNVRVLDEQLVLHTRWVALAGDGVEVEALDRAALTSGRRGHPLFAGVDRFRITGLGDPEIEQVGDTVRIRQPGLSLTAVGATVEREGQRIRIVAAR